MLTNVMPFLLSGLLFVLTFLLVVLKTEETFLIVVFLVGAAILAGVGVYAVSQSKERG